MCNEIEICSKSNFVLCLNALFGECVSRMLACAILDNCMGSSWSIICLRLSSSKIIKLFLIDCFRSDCCNSSCWNSDLVLHISGFWLWFRCCQVCCIFTFVTSASQIISHLLSNLSSVFVHCVMVLSYLKNITKFQLLNGMIHRIIIYMIYLGWASTVKIVTHAIRMTLNAAAQNLKSEYFKYKY